MADGASIDSSSDQQKSDALNATVLHDLALELAGEWGLSENDMDMYFPLDQATTQPPTMIVAAANPTKERVVGVCQPVDANLEGGGGALFGFGSVAQRYLMRYERKDPMDVDISRVQIKLLALTQLPKHGQMTMIENDLSLRAIYYPHEGYIGKDRVEATVAVGKDIVRVVYNFVVQRKATDQLSDAEHRKLCPSGSVWKISGASEEGGSLASLITNAGQTMTFADLPYSTFLKVRFAGPPSTA